MSDPDMGQPTVESERLLRIQHILDDCIERRIAGDPVSDQDLIAAHPDLLPELADELQHLAVIERARRRASDSKAGTDSGNASPLPETPAPPDLFPGYQVLDEIHRGGQGVVYRALQESTQRVVAIKVAAQGAWATEAEIARLEREVQVLGSLKHPGIVSIIDSGIAAAGSFYYVMHYIEGRPLDKYLRHRGEKATRKEGKRAFQGMPAGEAIDLLLQIGDAVNAAHLKGVIHRDLKPGNILIDGEGRPHLLDFGLAKIAEPEGVTAMTQTGQFVGSMPWASPEQAEGRTDQVDTRTDVYALGVVAYQMLTGQFPYEITGSIHEVIDRIINVSPQRPSGIRQGVDREIETIVLKCLSKEPDRRYQTAGELARDIRRFQANEPIEAKRDSGWYIVRKTISRHKAAFIASVAFVVLITASAISLAVMYRQQVAARDAEAMARREAESVLGFLTETLGQASPGLVNDRNMTVRTALDRAADRVSGDFPDSPRIEATIRNTIGVTYNGLGLYDEARVHLARALDIRRIEYGSQATPAVQTMVTLGRTEWELSKYPEAIRLQEDAVAAIEAQDGSDSTRLIGVLTDLGQTLMDDGRSSDAKRMLDRATAICQMNNVKDQRLARAHNAQGTWFRDQNNLARAEKNFRQALKLWKQAYGESHEHVAGVKLNIARVLLGQGKLDEAEQLQIETLASHERIFGPDHANIALCLINLAGITNQRGEFATAEKHLNRALKIREAIFEPGNPAILAVKTNLATTLVNRGELVKAEQFRRETVAAFKREFGQSHPRYISELERLGRVIEDQDRLDEAEEIYRAVLRRKRELLGDRHPSVGTTWTNIGSVMESRDRLDEAGDAYRKGLEIMRSTLPAKSDRLSGVLGMLGRLELRLKHFEEAETLLRECVEIRKIHLSGFWIYPLAMGRLGWAIGAQGRYEEGERMLKEAFRLLNENENTVDSAKEECAGYLAELYDIWQRPEQRDEWQRIAATLATP